MKEYRGVIIEESLNDNRIINELSVEKMIITGQENPLERWHMYEVSVSLEEIRKLASHILDEWYMHFWKEKEVIALFKEKEFKFNYDDKNTWNEVLNYGKSLGLPDYQLDFPINGL